LRGKAKKSIARELGLDIKTVRKWSAKDWIPQRRERRENVITPYAELIQGRFPEVGYNASVLDRELRAAGYEGSYPTVQRFVRPLRAAAQPEQATMRFETKPGEQAQVDW
jgi:transposase